MGLLNKFAEIKIWLGNGQSYAGDLKYPIALAVTLKLYLPEVTPFMTSWIVLGLLILIIFIGWFDLKFIKLHQKVAEISTEKYNPYFRKLKRKFK